MSPDTNFRNDDFGGTAAKRAEIVLRILREIRKQTSPEFTIGIKLNSVDAASSESLVEVMEQVKLIEETGVDFLEISGGTYENPRMLADPNTVTLQNTTDKPATKQSTLLRESFFLQFAQEVRSRYPKIILMVTGGFRTRLGMEAALKTGGCDMIGIARPAAVMPKLPVEIILNDKVSNEEAEISLEPVQTPAWMKWMPISSLGAGAQSDYYGKQIQRMGQGLSPIDTRIYPQV